LFECGRVILSKGQERLPDEQHNLCVVCTGAFEPATWRSGARPPDFYAAKGLLVGLLDALRVDWRLADGGPAFLHPGRAAEVLIAGREAGWVGEVHPLVARSFGLEEPPTALEIDLDVTLAAAQALTKDRDLISYPAVRQDIAVVVDDAIEARTVMEVVRAAGGPELRGADVFDLYRGGAASRGQEVARAAPHLPVG
jgi:phenylalanyl-tRNA synthetase beta chain